MGEIAGVRDRGSHLHGPDRLPWREVCEQVRGGGALLCHRLHHLHLCRHRRQCQWQ